MKITEKYRKRMAKSQHVQNKINELCALYGFNVDNLAVLLKDDGTIEISGLFITAIAKCHPNDKFDINKGLELALNDWLRRWVCYLSGNRKRAKNKIITFKGDSKHESWR